MAEVWVIENSNDYRFPAHKIAREFGIEIEMTLESRGSLEK